MDMLNINWKQVEEFFKSTAVVWTGVGLFWTFIWKTWLKKYLKKQYGFLYAHWRGNGEKILARLDRQDEIMTGVINSVGEIRYQVFPNGNKANLLGKVDDILNGLVIERNTGVAKLFLESSPIIKTDFNGECSFANLAFLKCYGYSSFDEVKGMGRYRTIHPDDREMVMREFKSSFKTGNMLVLSYRKCNLNKPDDWFKVTAVARLIKDAFDKPVEIITVINKQ